MYTFILTDSSCDKWGLVKPNRLKIFLKISCTLLLTAIVFSYFLTKEFSIDSADTVIRNVGIPISIIAIVWLYKFWRYKQDVDIEILKVEREFIVNNKFIYN